MANVDIRDLFWQVRLELPGVPNPVLYFNYIEAVREHLRRSLAWQFSCPNALDLAAGEAWPNLVEGTDIPSSTYVVEPLRVKFDGNNLGFKTRSQLDLMDQSWEETTASRPSHWTITSPGDWRVYPLLADDSTESLILRVALAPVVTVNDSATSVPEALAYEWSDAWAHGALTRLMKLPGKDWTNVALAASYGEMFEQDIKDAKSRAGADYGRPRRTVAYGGLAIGATTRRPTDDYGQ